MKKKVRQLRNVFIDFFSRPVGRAEFAVFFIYIFLTILIGIFHEPWFDEAESWQIARCASYYDIIFKIPHYEGHPPIWYLILSLFAKTGCPYEISLKAVSLAFASASAALILFKSPFPREIRLFLPFTYFIFYQYAVISRPYSLMMLAFFCLAAAYPEREEKKLRFYFFLSLLGLTSAYGILFAGSILMVCFYRLFLENEKRLRQFFHDRRLLPMLAEAVFLLAQILLILPRSDTYALKRLSEDNSPFLMFLYNLLGLPVESAFGDTITQYTLLNRYRFSAPVFLAEIFIGILLFVLIFRYARRHREELLFVVPMILFSAFCAFVYIYLHHTGILFLFLVFIFWTVGKPDHSLPEKLLSAAIHLSILILCAFSLLAGINEIRQTYGYGRSLADFLTKYELSDARIMVTWQGDDTNEISQAIEILPYFTHNIVYNVNGGSDGTAYDTHVVSTDEANKANLAAWRKAGPPDVLIGNCNLKNVYPNGEVKKSDYLLVTWIRYNYIWKGRCISASLPIYVRAALAESRGLYGMPVWAES